MMAGTVIGGTTFKIEQNKGATNQFKRVPRQYYNKLENKEKNKLPDQGCYRPSDQYTKPKRDKIIGIDRSTTVGMDQANRIKKSQF